MQHFEQSVLDAASKLDALRESLSQVIRGKSEVLEQTITALIAGGSVLIEDVPGVGKTTLAKTLAASLDLEFQRLQCTPDLLPADIIGSSVFDPQQSTFQFRPGPVFCNILLVDEINRASPRTQSALLEVMAEQQVTVDGLQRRLRPPFFVIATQNPFGFQGTYSLPESQIDRFLFRLSLDYPDADQEVDILFDQVTVHPLETIRPVLTKAELLQCQELVKTVQVSRDVAAYLVEIVRQTREDHRIRIGCSPRGSLMFFRAAQAAAFLRRREYVIPDDVQQVAPLVLSHRIILNRSRSGERESEAAILNDILERIAVPI